MVINTIETTAEAEQALLDGRACFIKEGEVWLFHGADPTEDELRLLQYAWWILYGKHKPMDSKDWHQPITWATSREGWSRYKARLDNICDRCGFVDEATSTGKAVRMEIEGYLLCDDCRYWHLDHCPECKQYHEQDQAMLRASEAERKAGLTAGEGAWFVKASDYQQTFRRSDRLREEIGR